MIILREAAGDTLTGVIDGANLVFTTSFPFLTNTVAVFVNGQLKVASLDDGYTITIPNTVTLKEAPIVGDTVEIEYKSEAVKTGGGALGGCPPAPTIRELVPGVSC